MSGRITSSAAAESQKDFGTDAAGKAARWKAEIQFARKEQQEWERQARAIRDRYRDEGRGEMSAHFDRTAANVRFNILWSNVQTLHPALYAQPPTVVVKRRYDMQDDVGRTAAAILQKSIEYQMHDQHFHTRMNETLLDYLLSGQGCMWLRYKPTMAPAPPIQMPPPQPAPPMAGPPQGAPPPMPPRPMPPPMPAPAGAPGGMQAAGMPPPAMGPAPLPPGGIPAPIGGAGTPAQPPMQPGPFGPGPAPPPVAAPAGAGLPPSSMPGGAPPPVPPMPLGGIPIGSIMDAEPGDKEQIQLGTAGQNEEVLAWEEVAIEHVGWDDFLCSPARTWDEVRWVARRTFQTRDELVRRFGRAVADEVPLDWFPQQLGKTESMQPENQIFRRAQVYEIWDKDTRRVRWLAYDYGERLLDDIEDPLRLLDFWPCPRPLYATQTTDTLVPVPDYRLYRDQATQIDELTARISAISRAIKVAGVYDAAQSDIQRVFQEGVENQLIPVNQWGAFAEQGGLKGCLDILDIGMLATVLQQLVEIRSQAKQDLYEVTGISDIIRGTTAATETATAQQLKAGFGTMRLRARQNEVSRFVRDVIRLTGDVICEHFNARTMIAMSEAMFGDDAKHVPQAVALLKDEKSRPFRLDMEADSTILVNQQQEQQGRLQFIQSVGQFIGQALPLIQQAPELGTLAGQMILFGVRSFPQGAELEGAFEQAVAQLEQAIKSGQVQRPPDPKQQAAQAQAGLQQAQAQNIASQIQDRGQRLQLDKQRLQADIANQQADNQRESQEAQARFGIQHADSLSKMHERAAGTALDTLNARNEHARALLELHGGRVDAARDFLLGAAKQQQDHDLARQQAANSTPA